ncbi:MAG TPA: DNA polymerase I [Planctomycetaceae bacterium]|nr:DNA polymerase I [Planctomycetaceae bacterium]
MTDTLYLVDTFSLVFQVYHAIRQPLSGRRGQPTNAAFGFTRDLKHLLEDIKPTHLVCALESPEPGIRGEWYPEYKAHRAEMPDDLRPQIPMICDLIEAYRIPIVQCPGWEADDVIATLTRQAVERGMEVRIVTNDKDARQLLGPHVKLYNIRRKDYLDEAFLLADWGVRPEQVIDFQALVGDSVDNVPGVPLVGPKKAGALLSEFGTLENVLANADRAKGAKLQENLKKFGEQARLSRRLVTLNDRLPLEVDWEAIRVHEPDRPKLLELFEDYAFGRLSDEVREQIQGGSSASAATTATQDYEIVDTPEKFASFLERLRTQRRFSLDLETTGLDAARADIVGWAFSWKAHGGSYVPVQGPPGQPTLDPATVLEALRPILEDPSVEIINQNIKYDMVVLRRCGVRLAGIGLDPMVGDYLLDAGARSHGLDNLAARYLNHRMIPISDLIGAGGRAVQKKMFEVDVPRVAEYAVEDAEVAWRLAEVIGERLRRENLWDLYWNLERPLIPVLAEMEFNGVRVDCDELKRQSAELTLRLDHTIRGIHELAGHEFNIGSPRQLAEVLFGELNLPALKRTQTGPSTSHEVLEQLAALHPLPAKIIEHRHLAKLKGTYLDALPQLINPQTGNVHTCFNQVVAATGRLSSNEPNLQNIPIRTEEGRQVRRAFVPSRPGWKLVCADYSQIELRMLAHFSGDAELQQAFREGGDIHTAVAAETFGVDPAAVSSDQRRVAKAVNFGVIYGQSPFGLAQALGIPKEQAARFIDSYFERYAGVDRYIQRLLTEVLRSGYATTILGRRRAITGIRSTTGRQRNLAERTAINTVIQGSAADLIKRAMVNLHARLEHEKHPARMLLQIHDELVFECPVGAVPSLVQCARREMTSALPLDVPLVVDVKAGENWLDAAAVEG